MADRPRLPGWSFPPAAPVSTLLAMAVAAYLLACAGEPAAPRNLLLVTLDTTRADHLGAYGYARETSPAFDALAASGVLFTQAYAQETNTNPSHASMFTGLYPHHHGNRENGQVLPADQRTLAERLEKAGFRTAAFVSGYTMLARATGFERGFDLYDDELEGPRRRGEETVDRALAWLGATEAEREAERFFLFVHLYDAHGPYRPSPANAGRFRSAEPGPLLDAAPAFQLRRGADGEIVRHLNPYVDAYDGALRDQDDQLARLLAAVDPETTLIVVLADHGESLGERYWDLGHGGQVFDEQIRIPWVLALPGGREARGAPARVDELVETVDLLPTLLELLALEASDRPLDGHSLVPLLGGAGKTKGEASPSPLRRAIFASARAETRRHRDRGYELADGQRIHAVRSAHHKFVLYPGSSGDYRELYDLRRDPGEQVNALEESPELAVTLEKVLSGWLQGAPREIASPDLAPEDLKRLRALGYLDG